MPTNSLDRLSEVKFQLLGEWRCDKEKLACRLVSEDDETKARLTSGAALYAFVCGGRVLYVGKTSLTLRQRFAGYCTPGKEKRTNRKCHDHIKQALAKGKRIHIHTLSGDVPLRWGEFILSIPAGLEDSIIKELSPPWNGKAGAQTVTESAELEAEALEIPSEEIQPSIPADVTGPVFEKKLGKTYHAKGFINVPADVSHHIGTHGGALTLILGRTHPDRVETKIDRKANPNGTPRLSGGQKVARWFQKHFKLGDALHATIVSRNEIILEEPR